jgi:hypothetical protein
VLLGNGDGTFQAPFISYNAGSAPDRLAVGDFNGDGRPDLAGANFDAANTVSILLNDGDWPAGSGGAPHRQSSARRATPQGQATLTGAVIAAEKSPSLTPFSSAFVSTEDQRDPKPVVQETGTGQPAPRQATSTPRLALTARHPEDAALDGGDYSPVEARARDLT